MWERLAAIDSRIIYALLLASIVVPLVHPIGLPIPVSKDTQRMYDTIAALPEGARVLIDYEMSGGLVPECEPQAYAIFSHLLAKKAKLYVVALGVEGPVFAERTLTVYSQAGMKRGVDFVNLGYASGGESGMAALCDDLLKTFPTDFQKQDTRSLPMMQGVKGIEAMDLIITFNGGAMGSGIAEWVRQAVTARKRPLAAAVTAVLAPGNNPYLQSGQLKAQLVGLKGAAEYEMLLRKPGKGASAMDAQSVVHILVIGLVVIGNIGYHLSRRTQRAEGGRR